MNEGRIWIDTIQVVSIFIQEPIEEKIGVKRFFMEIKENED